MGHARRRATLGARVALALGALLVPAQAGPPPPDFTGELRPQLPISAWFDDNRQRGLLRVGNFTSPIYPAHAVALADLDHDGTREVLLGIWSTEPRHREPEPHRTVWVLRWDDKHERLDELWRGSALARPLVSFTVRNERLVATERAGRRCLRTTYDWTGFGFAAIRSRTIDCETP